MANLVANASTFSWNSVAQGKVRSISLSENVAEVEVTDLDDTNNIYEPGTVDREITIDIIGENTIAVGDKQTAVIGWFSGGTDTFTNFLCTGRTVSGSVNGEIVSSYTFKQGQA